MLEMFVFPLPENDSSAHEERQHFSFGDTTIVPQKEITAFIQILLKKGTVAVICHDPRSDLEALQLLDIETSSYVRSLTSATLQPNKVYVLDTQVLYSALAKQKQQSKLEMVCKSLGVDTEGVRMHNAANDAVLTLKCFEKMMDRNTVAAAIEPKVKTSAGRGRGRGR
jgi:DNA polymerase III epsilon subunit-like protein